MNITSSKEVYKCSLFRVTEDQAVDPKTGFEIQRSVVRHNGSAVMARVCGIATPLLDGAVTLVTGSEISAKG